MIEAAESKKKKIFDGRYEIIGIIGRGADSVVYHAKQIISPYNDVALKVLIPTKNTTSDRLRHEALAIVSARHKFVIRLDDFHSIGKISYLAMEYAPNSDLGSYAKTMGGKLPILQAERFYRQVIEALQFMHSMGMYHRDIKPSNILVINSRQVRLSDFGLALLPGSTPKSSDLEKGVGTIDYMAPEVLRAEEYNYSSDLYLAATTFYEILSGKHPFAGAPIVKSLDVRRDENLVPLIDLIPDIPDYLHYSIMRALRFNVSDRFKSAGEILDCLEQQRIIVPEVTKPTEPIDEKINVEQQNLSPAETSYEEQEVEQIESGDSEEDYEIEDLEEDNLNYKTESDSNISEQLTTEPDQPDIDDLKEQLEINDQEDDYVTETYQDYQSEPISSAKALKETQLLSSAAVRTGITSSYQKSYQDRPAIGTKDIKFKPSKKVSILDQYTPKQLGLGLLALLFIFFVGKNLFFNGDSKNVATNKTEQAVISKIADIQFPNLPTGTYSGKISGLLLNTEYPLTIISFPEKSRLAVVIGLEGWAPTTIDTSKLKDSLIVKSSGFVLEMKGEFNGQKLEGVFRNILTGAQGKWNLIIQ